MEISLAPKILLLGILRSLPIFNNAEQLETCLMLKHNQEPQTQ